jgi:hypothetical protein
MPGRSHRSLALFAKDSAERIAPNTRQQRGLALPDAAVHDHLMKVFLSLLAWPVLVLLTACEASLFIGGDGEEPPSVNLAATVAAAVPGERIGLVAAASDDWRVDEVSFYRVEPNGSATLLERDRSDPYAAETVVPSNAVGTVQFFARARDDAGQEQDSARVSVELR